VQNSRALRWALVLGVAAMAVIGVVLLFLLTLATNNRELYERNYGRLFTINMVVAGRAAAGDRFGSWCGCILRLRRGKFGSRLLVKLAAIFALVGFMPPAC
jgi:nitrogen fixation/metabolism regulation signal transduction histidine kinase